MRAILIALALTLATLPAWAQTITPVPLPPEAEAAVKKGLIAANAQQWLIAIQSFQEARKSVPADAPVLFYNLGLAESKIPGRELRAIAWFGAYLAATPNAPNAAAVNDAIVGLQIKNQGNLNRLIKTVQDAASQTTQNKEGHLSSVARLLAEAGDATSALKIAYLLPETEGHGDDWRGGALKAIADAQLDAGDIVGAQRTADLILVGKDLTEEKIAEAQLDAGDIVGAQRTADVIHSVEFKPGCLIADAQIKARDIAGAQKTLASALKNADLIQNPYVKSLEQSHIAYVQMKVGDIAGALRTADLIQDGYVKSRAQQDIANARSKVGSTSNPPFFYDWLDKIDDVNTLNDCALNTGPFLDLAGYLKALPPSDDLQEVFHGLFDTAFKIAKAQNIIYKMQKRQAKQ